MGLLAAVPATIVVLAAVLDEEQGASDDPTRPAGDIGSRPEPQRCPPPGPAAVDPATGRTLCGAEARRWIRRYQRDAERRTRRMYGLTPAKERRARRIIARDPALRPLLRRTEWRVSQSGPWTAGGPTNELAGVGATLKSPTGFSGTAVLPYVCKGDPKQGGGRLRMRLRDVAELHVLVHLESGRVAQATPYDPSQPGSPPKIRSLGALPGSMRCPKTRD